MIKNAITIQETVDTLNDLVAKDQTAIASLVNNRVQCNKALAEHESAQVMKDGSSAWKIGLMGIINAMFGSSDVDTFGAIAAVFDEDMSLIGFEQVRQPEDE